MINLFLIGQVVFVIIIMMMVILEIVTHVHISCKMLFFLCLVIKALIHGQTKQFNFVVYAQKTLHNSKFAQYNCQVVTYM